MKKKSEEQRVASSSTRKRSSVVASLEKALAMGFRRELFIDDFLTERRQGMELLLHQPIPQPADSHLPTGDYMTMLQRPDGKISCYCRKSFFDGQFDVKPGFVNDYTAYYESVDGIHFLAPPLYLHDCSIPNVMRCLADRGTHNFAPFYDENPSCPDGERYKALGGTADDGGIWGFGGANPYQFQTIGDKPLFAPRKEWGYCFDSQNVCFWSAAESRYVCYFRLNRTPDGAALRTFCKATSDDFRHWEFFPQEVNLPGENLYVSQLAPYPRAKQIYVGTPTRFCEERGSATEIVLLFSREGGRIQRPSLEAWIRPGLEAARWGNRANYLACNSIQTSRDELSHYHAKSGVRYTLRTDGYMSLHAGYKQGEWLSRLMEYQGGELEINLSTSLLGTFQLEVLDAAGRPLQGYSLNDFQSFYGDTVQMRPVWRDRRRLSLKKGDLFRLRFLARECDVFSLAFL